MWENRYDYTGISVLPYDNGSYVQAPFTSCTKEEYEYLYQFLEEIDLTQVVELEDNTEQKDQVACSGGSCDLTM